MYHFWWVLLGLSFAFRSSCEKHVSQFGTDSKNVIFFVWGPGFVGHFYSDMEVSSCFFLGPKGGTWKNMSPSASSKCCHWKIHLGPLRPPFFPRFFVNGAVKVYKKTVVKCWKDVLEKKCCKRVFVETCCRQVLEKSVIDQSWSGAL